MKKLLLVLVFLLVSSFVFAQENSGSFYVVATMTSALTNQFEFTGPGLSLSATRGSHASGIAVLANYMGQQGFDFVEMLDKYVDGRNTVWIFLFKKRD
jgi:hypothetical protein